VDWPVVVLLLAVLVTFGSSLWMRSASQEAAARWRLVANVITAIAVVVLLGFAFAMLMD
jgi:hypothetical protein